MLSRLEAGYPRRGALTVVMRDNRLQEHGDGFSQPKSGQHTLRH
jgi:hypothetical protein